MASSKKKYFIFTTLFIPIVVLFFEILSYGIIKIEKSISGSNPDIKNDRHLKVPDIITGSNRFDLSKKELKNDKSYVDRHGLIKTIFSSDERINKNIKGILITGNSVALGYPLTHQGNYTNTFVNRIENKLRKNYNSIDLINLSYYGFNSWQENIQVARYLNSESNHYDLPSEIELIASLGGIQDFWNFIDLIHMGKEEKDLFYNANGLMTGQSGIFLLKFNQAMNGDLKIAAQILSSKLVRDIRRKSYTFKLLKLTRSSLPQNEEQKSANQQIIYTKDKLFLLLKKKLNISLKEYEKRKTIVVNSVSRNLKSMLAMNKNEKLLFVYLPTRFAYTTNTRNTENRYNYKDLNFRDLYVFEKDYRETLINTLKKIEGIYVFDISSSAAESWFVDESHYSEEGHKKIAGKLIPIFKKVME